VGPQLLRRVAQASAEENDLDILGDDETRDLGKLLQPPARHLERDTADELEPVGELAASTPTKVLRSFLLGLPTLTLGLVPCLLGLRLLA
jgi:hypothetical protein